MNRQRVAIVGGSGYTGGELARLLLNHPQVELTQVASNSHAGRYLHSVHPNLRKISTLRFSHPDDLTSCDILFLCLPHGVTSSEIDRYRSIAPRIIDLSADFRLRSSALYEEWYGVPHDTPNLLQEAVYGLPELHREELPGATLVSGTGCMATASILGLAPIYRVGLVNYALPLVVDAKVGSPRFCPKSPPFDFSLTRPRSAAAEARAETPGTHRVLWDVAVVSGRVPRPLCLIA